jgi:TrpR-related protein YerC/YecD
VVFVLDGAQSYSLYYAGKEGEEQGKCEVFDEGGNEEYFTLVKYFMAKNIWEDKNAQALVEALLLVQNKEEMRSFLRDLLTEKEIQEFALRWRVASLLSSGISYATIVKETGMSSTTIARIQKWLTGGVGGYRLLLERQKKFV